jgi:hypothetical protein
MLTGGLRVPTSVLLAVLAAAGLLALAPALVRRYDATERLAAERALTTVRVLSRDRRRRTVPGRRPLNPPRSALVTESPPSGEPSPLRLITGRRPARRPTLARHTPAVIRRRRVFAALLLLNVTELVGVLTVGPGFWISAAVTGTLLAAYLVHLRNRALADQRRRRIEAWHAAWLAARQAEVRRAQVRRAAARREAQRRMAAQKEAVRRAAMGLDRDPSELPAAAAGGSVSYRRRGALRGRAYEAGARNAMYSA